MEIIGFKTSDLEIEYLDISSVQSVCFVGRNRSGIRDLFAVMAGLLPEKEYSAKRLFLPVNPGIVSFKTDQMIYEAELEKDDTDYSGRIDTGTPAGKFLLKPHRHKELIQALNMHNCLDMGYRELSTGQARKLSLLANISKGYRELILFSPGEGLDARSRKELDEAMSLLHQSGVRLFLFVQNSSDIPEWFPAAVFFDSGKAGPVETVGQVKKKLNMTLHRQSADFKGQGSDLEKIKPGQTEKKHKNILVAMKDLRAGYGAKMIFEGLSLVVKEGDHTLVTGPNGSGKSTFLQVITGDHPACYQNDLTVFGIQRGSGESIWDIKKQMGIVSAELHRNYRVPGSTLSCVLSGLFDSIGVYRSVSAQQRKTAEKWLDRIGLEQKAQTPFRQLSYADQCLVLIARALIKSPQLLVLDEPTQGLDQTNRNALLDFLSELADREVCTILYASHREDEYRSFFARQIHMEEF